MVVSPIEDLRFLCVESLKEEGYDADSSEKPEEAFKFLEHEHYDAVLADDRLGRRVLNGCIDHKHAIPFLRNVKARNSRVITLMMQASESGLDRPDYVHVIQKPFGLDKLEEFMGTYLP